MADRPFCSEVSLENAEPLAATASRVDNWLLVEYRGLWGRDVLEGSGLTDRVKAHLREQRALLPHSKLLFVRRTDRRRSSGVAVFVARSREDDSFLRRVEVDGYEDLVGLDLASGRPAGARDVDHPLLLVCTHGKHDRCCARYGRPLYAALREQADADWVWQTSHVGGDRFAGNLVCLREGLYHGRVRPPDVFAVLEEYANGRVHLETYRGRSCYTRPVQAAERAVRERGGHVGIDDVRLVSAQREGDGWLVRFRTRAGAEVASRVEPVEGELAYPTCHSTALAHPVRYVAGPVAG